MNLVNPGAPDSQAGVKNEEEEKKADQAQPVVVALPTEKFQPISIRLLSIALIERSMTDADKNNFNQLTPLQKLSRLCQRIIALANSKLQNERCREDELYKLAVQNDDVGFGFGLLYYARRTQTISNLAKSLIALGADQTELETSKLETIGFLYRQYVHPNTKQTADDIFSLTSGDGWHRVSPFTDYTFPHAVLVRVLDSKAHSIDNQALVGNTLRSNKIFKEDETLQLTRLYDKFVTNITSRIRSHSSLYRLQTFRTEGGKYPKVTHQVEIETGAIRFHKQFSHADFPSLLDHLSRIYHGEKTHLIKVDKQEKILDEPGDEEEDCDDLAFWKYLKPVSSDEIAGLNQLMDTAIWEAFSGNISTPLFFSHRLVTDYSDSTSFRLVSHHIPRNKAMDSKWESRKSAQEVLELLAELIPDLKTCETSAEFAKIFREIKFEFKIRGNTQTCPLRDMFGGEVRITKTQTSYFRLGTLWLSLSIDYLHWVEKEFRDLLSQCLVNSNNPHHLPMPWPTDEVIKAAKQGKKGLYGEDVYNRQYSDQNNYLVGDRVTLENIELFDVLQYIPTSQELILYHVKKGFGQATRDAASQVRVSSELLHDYLTALPSQPQTRLDQLCKALEKRYNHCLNNVGGKETFINAFKRNKITYVYAVYDKSKKNRSLQDELKVREQLKNADFDNVFKNVSGDSIVKSLEEQGFLKDGVLTPQFRQSISESFQNAMAYKAPLELSKVQAEALYKHINALAVSPFDSLIARIELLKLRKQVEKKKMKFEICEIPKPNGAGGAAAEDEETEENASAVIASPDIPSVPVIPKLAEGSIFDFQGQRFAIEKTQGDGTCGLHSLFGIPNQAGTFCVANAQQKRDEFADRLTLCLQDVAVHPRGQQINEKFQEIILELLLGSGANGPNGKALAAKSSIIDKQDQKKNKELEADRQKTKEKVEEAVYKTFKKMKENNARKMNDFMLVLVPGLQNAAIEGRKNEFDQNELAFKTALRQNIAAVSRFEFAQTYSQSKKPFEKLAEILAEKTQLENKVHQNQNTLTDYTACIKDPGYWFLTNELCLVGLLYGVSVRIFAQTPTGELTIADEIIIPGIPLVSIFHQGVHFSRVTPL